MNEQEWAAVQWEQRRDTYHHRDGDYEYMVRQTESGEWAQLEKWVGEPGWPWAILGVADTAEAAKRIF